VREEQVVRQDETSSALGRWQPDAPRRAVPGRTADLDLSVLQANQARQGVQQRGLAGAVRAEHGDDLTGPGADLHVHPEQSPGQPDVGP